MPSSQYRRGYRFEARVREILEARGCFVARSAGSRFPDLVAVCSGEVWFVECKVNKSGFTGAVRERLLALAERHGAKPVIAYRQGRRTIIEELGRK